MEGIQPISPIEVESKWKANFDPLVIQAVNNLLVLKYKPESNRVVIKQDEIITEVISLMIDSTLEEKETKKRDIFDRHQLDIEDFYRTAGWEVHYDKAGYNETYYSSFFEFTIKKK